MAGATHVFYGEVESSRSLDNVRPDTIYRSARWEVRFNVLKALKGVNAGVLTETFISENGDPNEFRQGRHYLVYASRSAGQLDTRCTRTRVVIELNEKSVMQEIAQLEACAKKAER